MSTYYRPFSEPVTSVNVEDRGVHVALAIFINRGLSGTLVMTHDEASDFLHAISCTPIAQVYAAPGGLCRLKLFGLRKDDPENERRYVVDDSGREVVTIAALCRKYHVEECGEDGRAIESEIRR